MRRPPTAKVDYAGILRECLSLEDHRAIVRRAIYEARNGSVHARQWIYQHLMSPLPKTVTVEPDRREASELFRHFVDRLTPDELRIFARIYQRQPNRTFLSDPPTGLEPEQMESMAIAFKRFWPVMGLAKASLEANVRYMAASLGPEGTRVNGISAGPIRTLAASGIKSFRKMLSECEKHTPMRRNVTIEEVGNVAAFLCSDLASGISGEITFVDGGFNITAMGGLED